MPGSLGSSAPHLPSGCRAPETEGALLGVLFQPMLGVLYELFCKGGIKREERGTLPALNSKICWQHRDTSPDCI